MLLLIYKQPSKVSCRAVPLLCYYSQNFLLKYKSNLWLADRWEVIFILRNK